MPIKELIVFCSALFHAVLKVTSVDMDPTRELLLFQGLKKRPEPYSSHVEINASRTFLSPFTKGTRALVFVIRLVSFSGPCGHHQN